jgi:hypothetical protein
MNTQSYLDQAEKYKFNEMQARLGGDEALAEKYKVMSEMAVINSAKAANRDRTRNYYTYPTSSGFSIPESPADIVRFIVCGLLGFSIAMLPFILF